MKIKSAAKSRPNPVQAERTPRPSRKIASASEVSFTPKRILAPIDFSEPSDQALRYALDFARRSNGHLLLLHMVEAFPIRRQIAEVAKNEAADLIIVPTQKT